MRGALELISIIIIIAICVVPAWFGELSSSRFGLLCMASEVQFLTQGLGCFEWLPTRIFLCYLLNSRSVWVALDGFGSALLMLFA